MFDGSHAPSGIDGQAPQDAGVARLCALYDPLLNQPGATLAPGDADQLIAMADIFDLDGRRPSAEVWRDLRAVLVRQSPAADVDTAPDTAPLTLMLVEDDTLTAEALTEALTEAGHRVIGPFHDGAAAEASAGLHTIDLALLDMNLSGPLTGADLARALRDRWGVPSVFLSGDVSATARHAELAQGIVLKPYRIRDVLAVLARFSARNATLEGGTATLTVSDS